MIGSGAVKKRPSSASMQLTSATYALDKIHQADCIEAMAKLPEKSMDMIFADPPYNLQLQGELRRPDDSQVEGVTEEWDQFSSFQAYDDFTCSWLKACRRLLKDEGTIWVIGSYHNIFRVGFIMMDLGFWILNDVIWHKTNPMPNFRGTRFQSATETMIWAKKSIGQKKYYFNYRAMKNLNDDKQMQNVWHIPICQGGERQKINGRKAHPTQKPEQLLYRVIAAATKPGHIILDPFIGTGTTAVVAKKMARRFIGFEQDAHYVEIARQRLSSVHIDPASIELLETRNRRDQPRVKFGALIESGLLSIGQRLYCQNGRYEASVKADGTLLTSEGILSIHRAAAKLQGKTSSNGWDFWHIRHLDGNLYSIDQLRQSYLARQLTLPGM